MGVVSTERSRSCIHPIQRIHNLAKVAQPDCRFSEENIATTKRQNSVQQFQIGVYPGLYPGYRFAPGQTVVEVDSYVPKVIRLFHWFSIENNL